MKRPEGIGDTARRLLMMGATNKEALEGVLQAHPKAKTTLKCIRWYRHHLSNNFDAPLARDAPGLPPAARASSHGQAATATSRPSREQRNGSNARAAALALLRDLLLRWRTNEQAISAARDAYPEASVTSEDVRAARNELRRAGEDVPTSAEARRFLVGDARPTDPQPPEWVRRLHRH